MMYILQSSDYGDIVIESYDNGINKTGSGSTLEEALADLKTSNFVYDIITIVESEEKLRKNHPELFI